MYRNFKAAIAVLALVGSATWAQSATAAVVFSDNFNSYAEQLNWSPPSNWTAPGPGTVDLIGATTTTSNYDFFPGNGGYVDLNGSNGQVGTLSTIDSFAAGTYKLTFDLAGNARGDGSKTTVISLGNFSDSIVLAATAPFALESFTFKTSGGNLTFADLSGGNPNIGNILDNVSLSAVPEPATWAMLIFGFGMIGWTLRSARRRQTTALAA